MAISNTLKHYLNGSGISFDTIKHPYAPTTQKAAEAAHIPGHRLAKGILLADSLGYLLAVLPSPLHIDIDELNEMLNRNLELVDEEEIPQLFPDCDSGAVPPVGEPFKLEVALDTKLCDEPDIYFEAGDHVDLIHVKGTDFRAMLKDAERLSFAK